MFRRWVILGAALLALVGVGGWGLLGRSDYHVRVVLPTAPQVIKGAIVNVNGFDVGKVASIHPVNNHAIVDVTLDDGVSPLHDGAKVDVSWKAVLGERHLEVHDGPAANAAIPDGGILRGQMPEPVEIDKVLDALDPHTRDHVSSLVKQLNGTLQGHEPDVNSTVRTAGPALNALGQVLQGLGSDGGSIKELVGNTDNMVTTLAQRDQQVSGIVEQLSVATQKTAQQRQRLSQGLKDLPGTLRDANGTLSNVPGTVHHTVPLLRDLQPATRQLPELSRNLSPLLQDVRPATAQLRPTLDATSNLLEYTPGLLESAHATLPTANSALHDLKPALPYLRAFSPELVGWMSNWGSANANFDRNGHYFRTSVNEGTSSANVNPGVLPPGISNNPYPAPGALENQPWTDAFGSGVR